MTLGSETAEDLQWVLWSGTLVAVDSKGMRHD